MTTVVDQAARLRLLMRHRGRCARTLAITSGKGGVGKSNIAVNLSICLAARGLRVALVDVDLGLANADLLMNVQPRFTLAHVISGVRSLSEVTMEAPGGIRFIPGASGLHELANLSDFDRQHLIAQLQTIETSTDIVVFDCGAGISRHVLGFALAADDVLVVTTPQPPAITDAYATIKSLHREKYPGRISLFVNMAEHRSEAQATYQRISAVAQKFLHYSVANGGNMLHDRAVELAVRQREPFVLRYPGCKASSGLIAAANDWARSGVAVSGEGGFFRKVVGLFM